MKKINLSINILLISTVLLNSCVNSIYKKADKEYGALRYSDAVTHYEKAISKKDFPGTYEKLGYAYFKMNNIVKAEENYRKAIEKDELNPEGQLSFAAVLLETGKYTEAYLWANKYLSLHPDDIFAQMITMSCLSVKDKYRDTTLYTLNKIETPGLTNVFGTTPYKNGVVVAADKPSFSGRKTNPWTGTSYLDLYYMEKDSTGKWLNPVLMKGNINGFFHEGPATFTSDGNTVYFTRSSYLYNKTLNKNESNISNLKIYKATSNSEKWSKPESMPFNSDDYSCGHPTLSEDGNTLYFISDMPGGFGGTDIYKCTFDGTAWSKPENLGKDINTPGNEMFPYMHNDGTLYFSSNGHNTLGGLDVFITTNINGKWARPENLNYPLNSRYDDFSITVNDKTQDGFVTSSRVDGKDQLYTYKKNPPTFILYGKARKKGTDIPVEDVIVEITNADTKNVISKKSDKDGKFELKLETESEYLLYCTKLGCFTRTDNISTKGKKYSENFYADFEVEEIVIDKPIVLENIYYDFDKWEIRADAAKELNYLVKILEDNPTISIELSSHTDWRGSDKYNLVLSDKRAHAAVDYIISKGISPDRITAKGYGETKPINECTNYTKCTEEEYQANRRTEFKVTKIAKAE